MATTNAMSETTSSADALSVEHANNLVSLQQIQEQAESDAKANYAARKERERIKKLKQQEQLIEEGPALVAITEAIKAGEVEACVVELQKAFGKVRFADLKATISEEILSLCFENNTLKSNGAGRQAGRMMSF